MTTALAAPPLSLYPYQTALVTETREALKVSGSAVIVLPTGGGKTVVAARISQMAIARRSPVMFLVHRRELVRQAVDTLAAAVPDVDIGVEAAGWPSKPWALLQVGSIQSLARRTCRRQFRLVFIDEAHHCRAPTWEKVLGYWPDAWRIGLTATPERLDGKGLGQHFDTLVEGPSIQELVAGGYLAPTKTLTIPTGLQPEKARLDRNGEVRQDDMAEQVTAKVVANAADAYLRYAAGRRAIFFGIHRQHSRDVCAELQARGVRAAHVDGDDHTSRRDRIMAAFKTGGIDVVGNCDLISEGFDAPACDVVMIGKFTKSTPQFLQMAGRAQRFDPQNPNKVALCMDLTGVCKHLGLPDEPREWSLEDGLLQLARERRKLPVRVCETCLTTYRLPPCPSCGATPTLTEVDEVETELVAAVAKPKRAAKTSKAQRARVMATAIKADSDDDARAVLAAFNRSAGYKPNYMLHWVMQQRNR